MATELQDKSAPKSKPKDKYRLVVMNDETFEEIGSYRLVPLNLYLLASSILVLVVMAVASIIVFTPIRYYIPGYGDVNIVRDMIQMTHQVDSLELMVERQNLYISQVQKIMSGDLPTAKQVEQEEKLKQEERDSSNGSQNIIPTERSPEEDALINKVVEQASIEQLLLENVSQKDKITDLYMGSPLSGSAHITDEFRPEDNHFGLDLADKADTPVKAVMSGIVMVATYSIETGNMIGIQHENNLVSFYKHNSVLLKKVGNFVRTGEAVAIIGNTGEYTNGSHLHFELWYDGQPVDPQKYINFK